MTALDIANILLESDDYSEFKDFALSGSKAGSKPSSYDKAISRIGGLLKSATRAGIVARWKVVPGDQPPKRSGTTGGHFTRGGSRIHYPSAYGRRGWSNMVYHTNSEQITVGLDWIRKRLPREVALILQWKSENAKDLNLNDLDRSVSAERERYNVDDPVLGENRVFKDNDMSRARELIEAMTPMPESFASTTAPTAPPKPKRTGDAVPKPVAPQPGKTNPSPFRRKDIKPDDEPRPKACMTHEGAAFRSGTSAKLGGKAKKLITGKSGKSQSSLAPKKTF